MVAPAKTATAARVHQVELDVLTQWNTSLPTKLNRPRAANTAKMSSKVRLSLRRAAMARPAATTVAPTRVRTGGKPPTVIDTASSAPPMARAKFVMAAPNPPPIDERIIRYTTKVTPRRALASDRIGPRP